MMRQMGEAAYRTIRDEWSAKTAANRLKELISCINLRKPVTEYNFGPLSVAGTMVKEMLLM